MPGVQHGRAGFPYFVQVLNYHVMCSAVAVPGTFGWASDAKVVLHVMHE